MSELTIVLPERQMDQVADDLVTLTERIDQIDQDAVAHGFLGGQHGYGAHWNNDTFQMRPFCWCERSDCAWCGGCECNTALTVDGKDVTFDESQAFFKRETGEAPCGNEKAFAEWRARAEAANKRRGHRIIGEKCDYCAGRGVFSTNGAEPGKGAPNFWHKPSGFKVWWYKYIGRSMESIGRPSSQMLAECLGSLSDTPSPASSTSRVGKGN